MRNVAMRRKKTRNPAPNEVPVADEDAVAYLKDVEGRFQKLLSPVEAYIMGIQSTLVWEIPSFSGCVFIAVNILFWLATRMRFYHLLGLTGLTVVFVDIWIHKIWPEIRVPPSPEDLEEWTLVHPKLLSVPEISRHLSRLWITISGVLHWFIILRGTSHAKFFLVMMVVLIVIGVIGLYLSGITLLYILVMSVFILPPLVYYNMFSELYKTLEPTILRVEKVFNVKRTRSKKKSGRDSPDPETESQAFLVAFTYELDQLLNGKKKDGGDGDVGSGTDSDEGLEEFVPQSDGGATTLLKATTNESSEESSGHTPGLLTPDMLSQAPSRDISDTDSVGDETTNFARGLKSLPDFDDSQLDDSLNHDEGNLAQDDLPDLDAPNADDLNLLPADPLPDDRSLEVEETDVDRLEKTQKKSSPTSETMQFVTGHFKDSSESDMDIEGELATGLAFPDIQDELDVMAQEESSSHAAMAQEVVSRTMSTLMSSTMSGLSRLGETASRLGETVRSVAKSATTATTGDATAETTTDTTDSGGISTVSGSDTISAQPGETPLRKTITESTDSDILAEFEFLEQEDLDVLEDDSTAAPPVAAVGDDELQGGKEAPTGDTG